ncbi:MAG: ABC transporter permease [Bacteroidetes bacterium]|nr:MAG: ABC transporter permease [Bacteroidota bacterium]
MFGIYLKTAWRNILRGNVYSILNLAGLATGMAVALVIGLWVAHQVSYDKFLPGYERAYQVRFRFSDNGLMRNQAAVSLPVGNALKHDVPEIAYVAPSFGARDELIVNDKRIVGNGRFVGEEFLQVFPFPLVEGNALTALKDPGSVVISESLAKIAFGDGPALNKTLRFVNRGSRKVTAVIKDLPKNSSFHFDLLFPFMEFSSVDWVKAAETKWGDAYFELYASLKPGADPVKAQQKASQLVKHYSPDTYATFHREAILFPMKDWHLVTGTKDGWPSGGLIEYVRMFGIVGVLVLLIACINFTNLSTARSEKRAREVGVRKVIGGSKRGLILQFLIESQVMTFTAFALALLIVQNVLPAFAAMTGDIIRIPWSNGLFWLAMIGYVFVTGLLAGSRPAFYFSSFQPVKVLKGTIWMGRRAALPRKVLVVLQFTCSIALIIGTVIIYQQIQHAKERPRGYDPNRLLTSGDPGGSYPSFKQEVLQTGVVSGVTRSLSPATEIHSHNIVDQWPGMQPGEAFAPVMNAVADNDFFKTLGIGFVEGNNFTGNSAVDSPCVIVNEAAVKRMRLKQPINAYIHWPIANAPQHLRIIGVVKNILTNNPFGTPEPTIYVYQPGWTWTVTYRIAPMISTPEALATLKSVFTKYNHDASFDYSFVDDQYASMFTLETLIGRLAGVFAGLAIFISCLGLFGLAAYTAEQRTKEIGIRKVLGASVSQVTLLLSGSFIKLVLVSCGIASPIAYYFLHQWLADYYYRIDINPLVFLLAAIVAIIITALTVGYQSLKMALRNPVRSLHSE